MTTCNERLDLVTKDHLRKVKPIQNFPDCFRFVAEVADDFLKIFDETSDQKGKGQNTLIKTNTLLINRPPKQQLSPITKGSEPIRPKPNTKHTIASHPEQNYGVPHAHIRPVLSEKGSKQISNASIQTQKLTRSKTVSPGHRYVAEKSADLYEDDEFYQLPTQEKEPNLARAEFCNDYEENDIVHVDKTEFFRYNAYEVAFELNRFGLTTLAKVCQEFGFDGKHFQTLNQKDLQKEPYALKPAQVERFLKVIGDWRPHNDQCIDEKNDANDNYDVPPGPKQVEAQHFTHTDANPNNVQKDRHNAHETSEDCADGTLERKEKRKATNTSIDPTLPHLVKGTEQQINKYDESIRSKPSRVQTIASHFDKKYDVPPAYIRSVLPEKESAQKANASIKTSKLKKR